MEVREIKHEELGELISLYEHLHDEETRAPEQQLNKTWNEILANPDIKYFVAASEGKLVSACNIIIIPNLTRQARPIALIENVVTHSQYRKRGLGKKVMQLAIDLAKDRNCYKVMLLSNQARKESHLFYSSLGFSSDDKVGFVLKIK